MRAAGCQSIATWSRLRRRRGRARRAPPGSAPGRSRTVRHVGVGVERDVGDGVAVGGEEIVLGEMLLHHAERAVALLHPVLQRVLLQLAPALDQRQPEIGGAEVGLEACCSKNIHCSISARSTRIVGQQRRAARRGTTGWRSIRRGSGRARPRAAARGRSGFIARNSGVRVSPWRMSISTSSCGDAELREREPHLVAIARAAHGIERVHPASSPVAC